ncbi:hypothetical protein PAPYR_4159 [Paratrimastix pyriformis]|uniref:Uncharacterized protein n=1 Tax=Paratrimastix pyriformis TaxID=342808 RepID=A0ABQ8UP12_9EUKA|nr:hypothetical protein PAPYR_4159 [Paratrimastix pyriformis]
MSGKKAAGKKLYISQETFDQAVKENMDDFGMEREEAVSDAVRQFETQGVDLSNINKGTAAPDAAVSLPPQLATLEAFRTALFQAYPPNPACTRTLAEDAALFAPLLTAMHSALSAEAPAGLPAAIDIRTILIANRAVENLVRLLHLSILPALEAPAATLTPALWEFVALVPDLIGAILKGNPDYLTLPAARAKEALPPLAAHFWLPMSEWDVVPALPKHTDGLELFCSAISALQARAEALGLTRPAPPPLPAVETADPTTATPGAATHPTPAKRLMPHMPAPQPDGPLARALRREGDGGAECLQEVGRVFAAEARFVEALRACCMKHESHRHQLTLRPECALIGLLRAGIHQCVELGQLHLSPSSVAPLPSAVLSGAPALVRALCAQARILTNDDDVRVHAGHAHEHSRWMVEAGLAQVLLGLVRTVLPVHASQPRSPLCDPMVAECMSTLARITTRQEHCEELLAPPPVAREDGTGPVEGPAPEGVMPYLAAALQGCIAARRVEGAAASSIAVGRQAASLARALSSSDSAKQVMVQGHIPQLLVDCMAQYSQTAAAAPAAPAGTPVPSPSPAPAPHAVSVPVTASPVPTPTLSVSPPTEATPAPQAPREVPQEVVGLVEQASAALAGFLLRNPSLAAALTQTHGLPAVVVQCMRTFRTSIPINQKLCHVVRNSVARASEKVPIAAMYLELGIESLIRAAMTLHVSPTAAPPQGEPVHDTAVSDEVRRGGCWEAGFSALRDLGCRVEFREEWKGTGLGLARE